MGEAIQRVFAGLHDRGAGQKEPQDSAARATNCDLSRDTIEPRPGRLPIFRANFAPALSFDGSMRRAVVVPNTEYQTNTFTCRLVFRWRNAFLSLQRYQQQRFYLFVYTRGLNREGGLFVQDDWFGAGSPGFVFHWRIGGVDYYVPIDIAGLVEAGLILDGDTISTYLFRNGSTLGMVIYRNGDAVNHVASAYATVPETASPQGAPGCYVLGGDGYLDPTFGFIKRGDGLPTVIGPWYFDLSLLYGDWVELWHTVPPRRRELSGLMKTWELTLGEAKGWKLSVSPSQATAWIEPLPVSIVERSFGAYESCIEFCAGTYARVTLPEVDPADRILAIHFALGLVYGDPGLAYCVPVVSTSDFIIGTFPDTSDPSKYHIRVVLEMKNGCVHYDSVTVFPGDEPRLFIATVDEVTSQLSVYYWNGVSWLLALPAISLQARDEVSRSFYFGGHPRVGLLPGEHLCLQDIRLGFIPAVTAEYLANFASPGSPLGVASFCPTSASDRRVVPLLDRSDIDGIPAETKRIGIRRIKAVNNDSITMECWPIEQASIWSQIEYFKPWSPPLFRAAAATITDSGEREIVFATDVGVGRAMGTDINFASCTGMTAGYRARQAVVPKEIDGRVFFFGAAATKQKVVGDRLSPIGLESPWPVTLSASSTPVGNLGAGTYGFRFALYNSLTGHESVPSVSRYVRKNEASGGLLLSLFLHFRADDDWDQLSVYRQHLSTGTWHLETRTKRLHDFSQSEFWNNYAGDARIPVLLSEDELLLQPGPKESNNPPPPALIGEYHQSRLWLVDVDDPAIIHYSNETFIEAFPAFNWLKVGSAGDPITALVSTELGLLVGKRNSIWFIARGTEANPVPDMLTDEVGIAGAGSVARLGNTLFWLSAHGVVAWANGSIQVVSDPIREHFATLDPSLFPTAYGAVWPERRQYWLLVGQELLVLDVDTGRWTNGVMGASWLGTGVWEEGTKPTIASAWYGGVSKLAPKHRLDSAKPNQGWWLEEGVQPIIHNGKLLAVKASSEVDRDGMLLMPAFLSIGPNGFPSPDPLKSAAIGYVHTDAKELWFAEPIETGASQFSIYLPIPVEYRSQALTFEGPHLGKRLAYLRVYWHPDARNGEEINAAFSYDEKNLGTRIWSESLGFSSQGIYTQIRLGWLATSVRFRFWLNGLSWPRIESLQWLYSVRRKQ